MNHSRPRRAHIWLLSAALIVAALSYSHAAKKSGRPKVVADASYLRDLLEAPVPNYPVEAVKKAWSGIGVFELHFRPNGSVSEVGVALTTGHELLDQTARAALFRWRCKPGAMRTARMTMRFSTGEKLVEVDGNDEGATKRGNFAAAPRPRYPYEARRRGEGGFGVFVIRFGDDGAATNVVALKSTGSIILDNDTILTFRKWRCRPGLYTTILVPLTYLAPPRRH